MSTKFTIKQIELLFSFWINYIEINIYKSTRVSQYICDEFNKLGIVKSKRIITEKISHFQYTFNCIILGVKEYDVNWIYFHEMLTIYKTRIAADVRILNKLIQYNNDWKSRELTSNNINNLDSSMLTAQTLIRNCQPISAEKEIKKYELSLKKKACRSISNKAYTEEETNLLIELWCEEIKLSKIDRSIDSKIQCKLLDHQFVRRYVLVKMNGLLDTVTSIYMNAYNKEKKWQYTDGMIKVFETRIKRNYKNVKKLTRSRRQFNNDIRNSYRKKLHNLLKIKKKQKTLRLNKKKIV